MLRRGCSCCCLFAHGLRMRAKHGYWCGVVHLEGVVKVAGAHIGACGREGGLGVRDEEQARTAGQPLPAYGSQCC